MNDNYTTRSGRKSRRPKFYTPGMKSIAGHVIYSIDGYDIDGLMKFLDETSTDYIYIMALLRFESRHPELYANSPRLADAINISSREKKALFTQANNFAIMHGMPPNHDNCDRVEADSAFKMLQTLRPMMHLLGECLGLPDGFI